MATRYQLGLTRHAGSADGAAEGVDAPGDLRVGHELGQGGGHVGGERVGELVAVEEQESVAGRQDRGDGRPGRRVGDQGVDRLALVGCERGDVDERGDLVVGAGFGDDDAAVGVADEHDRSGLSCRSPVSLRRRHPRVTRSGSARR